MVSIIIPCYNAENFLDACLSSVAAQTYRDIELICINDGSTDNTLALLKQYQEKKELRIQIIDKANQGVSKARNDGLLAASGENILFLDSDDKYHPQYVEKLVSAMKESGSDTAYCRLSRNMQRVFESPEPSEQYVIQDRYLAMEYHRLHMTEVNFYCFIFRRDIILRENIRFDSETKFGEDREFLWKYLCHCNQVAFVDMPLYWYRSNEASATKSHPTWQRIDILRSDERVKDYLQLYFPEYAEQFWNYMFPRTVLSIAKLFAMGKDKALFAKLQKEYDVRQCMKQNLRDHNKFVVISALCYLIHPMLFFYLMQLKK